MIKTDHIFADQLSKVHYVSVAYYYVLITRITRNYDVIYVGASIIVCKGELATCTHVCYVCGVVWCVARDAISSKYVIVIGK